MERVTYSYCIRFVDSYKDEIKSQIVKIEKNFRDMDLSNASVQEEMSDVIEEIKRYCYKLISDLESYSFD